MGLLRLTAYLGLNATGFQTGLKQMEGSADKFGTGLSRDFRRHIQTAFGTAAIIEFIRHTMTAIDRVEDLSKQFSVTTTEVQQLDVAAKRTGLSFEDFGTALMKMGAARKEAVEKNRDLREAFAQYGISLEELNDPAVRNIDLLKKMASAMEDMTLTAKQTQELREIFGKTGSKLTEAMREFEKAKSAAMFKPADIESVHQMRTAWENLSRTMEVAAAGPIAARLNFWSNQIRALTGEGEFRRTLSLKRTLEKQFKVEGDEYGLALIRQLESSLLTGNIEQQQRALEAALSRAGRLPEKKAELPAAAPYKPSGEAGMYKKGIEEEEAKKLWEKSAERAQAEYKAIYDQLSWLQKKKALEKQIADDREAANAIETHGRQTWENQMTVQELRKDAAKKELELYELRKSGSKEHQADALSRMGLFSVNAENILRTPLERIAQATERTAENTRPGNQDIGL